MGNSYQETINARRFWQIIGLILLPLIFASFAFSYSFNLYMARSTRDEITEQLREVNSRLRNIETHLWNLERGGRHVPTQ